MIDGTKKLTSCIGTQEIAFVDTSICGYEDLQKGVRDGIDVVLIDGTRGGLAQIAAALAGRGEVDAIHIFCHGSPGALHLGAGRVTENSLAASRAELAVMRSALADRADLLLYGCDVAQGAQGASFIEALSAMVGANVAASNDPTGSAPLGGNWNLEVTTGVIDAQPGLTRSGQAAFSGLLGISSDGFDSYNLILSDGRQAQLTVGAWVFGSSKPVNIAAADGIELPVWLNNDGGSSDRAVIMNFTTDGVTDPVVTGPLIYSIKSADGSNFQLNSFKIGQMVGSQSNVMISAYSNGMLVASQVSINLTASASAGNISYSFEETDPDYGRYGTLNFNAAYDNIDEIRLEFSGTADLHIDDINIGPLVSDTKAPTFTSATVNGTKLVLKYSDKQYLDSVNIPATGAFAVTAGGGSVVVNSVSVDAAAKTVTLTLASAVAAGVGVTVAYTDPTGGNDAKAIQDVTGNDAASFGATSVTNNTLDTTGPAVTGVSVPSNASYGIGNSLSFTVTFDENIVVTGTNSTLALTIGAAARQAEYASKTGNSVTYTYTVQAGDTDADGISVGAIALGTTLIRDGAGNDANLTLTGRVPATTGLLVDTTAPAIAAVAVPSNAVYVTGQSLDFEVTFDENVIVSGSDSALELTIGGATRSAEFHSSSGSAVTYRYTVQAGDADADGISVGVLTLGTSTIRDAAGSDASLGLSGHVPALTGVLVDGVAPSVTGSITVPANGSYNAGQLLRFTVQFDENVTITGTDSTLGLTVGSAPRSASFASKTATSATYEYVVQAGDTDTDGIAVGAIAMGTSTIKDSAGNDAGLSLAGHVPSTAGILVDTTAPTVGSVSVPSNATYLEGQNLDFVVTFDENVTISGSDSSLALAIGSAVRSATFLSSAGNTVTYRYTVQAGEIDADGIAIGGLSLGSSVIRDAAGNDAVLALSSVGSTANVFVDSIAPSVAGMIGVPANGTYAVGQVLNFTVTFDEKLSLNGSPSTLGLTIGNAARSATMTATTDSSITYSYIVQDGDADDDGIAVTGIALNGGSIRDVGGNDANLAMTGQTPALTGVFVDGVAPSLSSATINGNTLVLTYTDVLDALHGPVASDYTVVAGSSVIGVAGVSVDALGKTVTLTLATPATNGQVVFVSYTDPTSTDDAAAVQDMVGNDAASVLNFAVTNSTPASASTAPSIPDTTLPDIERAFMTIASGAISQADAEEVLAAIKSGKLSFDTYLNNLIDRAKPTALPGLVMTQFFGATPSEQHLSELIAFGNLQLDFYTKMGVANPELGPFEAVGLGFSETQAFKSQYGSLADGDFIFRAYSDVFGRMPSTVQNQHFADQIEYFELIYANAGKSHELADLHAKGAVLGQMIGAALLDEADLHLYDDVAMAFLKDAAHGQVKFGEFDIL